VSDYCHISWTAGEARVKGFNASNRGKATTVRIELEVTDSDALSWIMRQLQEAQQAAKLRTVTTPTRRARARQDNLLTAADVLALLPAPPLKLSDQRGGRR